MDPGVRSPGYSGSIGWESLGNNLWWGLRVKETGRVRSGSNRDQTSFKLSRRWSRPFLQGPPRTWPTSHDPVSLTDASSPGSELPVWSLLARVPVIILIIARGMGDCFQDREHLILNTFDNSLLDQSCRMLPSYTLNKILSRTSPASSLLWCPEVVVLLCHNVGLIPTLRIYAGPRWTRLCKP